MKYNEDDFNYDPSLIEFDDDKIKKSLDYLEHLKRQNMKRRLQDVEHRYQVAAFVASIAIVVVIVLTILLVAGAAQEYRSGGTSGNQLICNGDNCAVIIPKPRG